MAGLNTYIALLTDALEKKNAILMQLLSKTQEQTMILDTEPDDFDAIDRNVSAKGNLIEELNSIDNGFDRIYDRISKELTANKAQYSNEIKTMQHLISEIMNKSVSIQTLESRNRDKAEAFFRFTRKNIHEARMTNKVAESYYNNMVRKTGNESEIELKF